jgi:GNAT superfamily N-acetyltransferase
MPPLQLDLRRIAPGDVVDDFACGDPGTDRFLRYYALAAQTPRALATTWVAVATDGARVVDGFLTTSTATLDRAKFPDAALMKRLSGYPVPVLRVSRLGVSLARQRRGLGAALLAKAEDMARLLRVGTALAPIGVVVDTPEAGVAFLERQGFVRLGGRILEGALHGGPVPMFRPLDSAPAAQP